MLQTQVRLYFHLRLRTDNKISYNDDSAGLGLWVNLWDLT